MFVKSTLSNIQVCTVVSYFCSFCIKILHFTIKMVKSNWNVFVMLFYTRIMYINKVTYITVKIGAFISCNYTARYWLSIKK